MSISFNNKKKYVKNKYIYAKSFNIESFTFVHSSEMEVHSARP